MLKEAGKWIGFVALFMCSIHAWTVSADERDQAIAENERISYERDRAITENERRSYGYAMVVPWSGARAPFERMLLVRRGKDLCALRFTEFHRGRDAQLPSMFHSGEESFYAEYDWYYQGDGSGNLGKENVKSGHEKLAQEALIGIGRLAFQLGETRVKCGPFKLHWGYTTSVAFYEGSQSKDDGIELAPTKWRSVSEIDLSYSRLKWYRYDPKGEVIIYIPLDDL